MSALFGVLSKKYVWWQPGLEPKCNERRVIAQVMNIGDFDDVTAALEAFGARAFIDILTHADPGWFSPKSWSYWHYRLGLIPSEASPPPMPKRSFSA